MEVGEQLQGCKMLKVPEVGDGGRGEAAGLQDAQGVLQGGVDLAIAEEDERGDKAAVRWGGRRREWRDDLPV